MRAAIGYLSTVFFTVGFLKWAFQDAASALDDPTSLFHVAMEPLGTTVFFLLVCIVLSPSLFSVEEVVWNREAASWAISFAPHRKHAAAEEWLAWGEGV